MTDTLNHYLSDFLRHANQVSQLVEKGRLAFDTDDFLRYAAEALMIRLGEIVARMELAFPDLATEHPELELRQLKGTRNVIAHGYDIMDYDIVWEVISVDIPRVAAYAKTLRCQNSAGREGISF